MATNIKPTKKRVSWDAQATGNQATGNQAALGDDGQSRVVIESVTPSVDGGKFAIKRVVGDSIRVRANIFCDGHDSISAVLRYRFEDETQWREQPMQGLLNDSWEAEFPVNRLGRYYYCVQAWIDHFQTWHGDLRKRVAARQTTAVDLQIGANLVEQAAARMAGSEAASSDAVSSDAGGGDREQLTAWVRRLRSPDALVHVAKICDATELLALMARCADRAYCTASDCEFPVTVDRERARFSAWYEMFPRSASEIPGRRGTLRDVEARLPYVAAMGFDVLYLPPIHPVGTTFRKGPNNSTTAGPDDVGSPWAIGSAEGGHKGLHSELGSWEDFNRLVAAAREYGIDIAMDIAFQCSPDHPYVEEHPEWFRARPDGTIQYAENPPKKYQDIYPFDFESRDWRGLWEELKSVFEFWISRGVRIFRVDNPHTKPFPFWQWCIGEIKRAHPDVIFLAEAFTRPNIMHRLAKLGFTQSYTYFAWRNTKHELTRYVEELIQPDLHDFFRPNFWPNTPDILTEQLQIGGRAAFMSRFVLAATLTASYGIYGPPFEHQWSQPSGSGGEEYLDSEKYEVHHHDLDRPDSLKDFIARINRLRREFAPLQRNDTLQFHDVDNDNILCYSKASDDRADVILVAVSLDPNHKQSGWVTLPMDDLNLDSEHPYQMHDLLGDARYLWHGERNYIELDPHIAPAHIFQIKRRVRSEQDFEYYL